MKFLMNKERIAHRFSSALNTYDTEAVEQRHIAEQLASMIRFWVQTKEITLEKIAEVGCGTGLLSTILKRDFSPKRLWLNDLCTIVGNRYESWSNTTFCSGDIEELMLLPKEKAVFPIDNDLIASSSVIQWLDDPIKFLLNCKSYLAKGGILAVSTFGENNFIEIRTITGRGLRYIPMERLIDELSCEYTILASSQTIIKQIFSSPLEVLRHLKRTGVTGVSDIYQKGEFRWSSSGLEKFSKEYLSLYHATNLQVTTSDQSGPNSAHSTQAVELTYNPIYLLLKSK